MPLTYQYPLSTTISESPFVMVKSNETSIASILNVGFNGSKLPAFKATEATSVTFIFLLIA